MNTLKTRKYRRPIAEINVVPYIDVMLVLLIIFMATAPLITQGVHVNLPQVKKVRTLPQNAPAPFIISVKNDGAIYINIGNKKSTMVDDDTLMLKVAAALKNNSNTQVMLRGDKQVNYGRIVQVMALAQAAGSKAVGLITETKSGH